jgi:beta-galactosidase
MLAGGAGGRGRSGATGPRMRMSLVAALVVAVGGLASVRPGRPVAPADDLPAAGARRVSFDAGWRFHEGDDPRAASSGFADTDWRRLDLPHDWAIEQPFDPKLNPHTAALRSFGVAWYRKHFTVPAGAEGRYYAVEIDGAMSNATVFLNGRELGGRPYGYIGFAFDLTPALVFGGENVIAVRLAPEDESSRWYPGAGLYRHVWIDATGPVHVARDGTFVTTTAVTEAAATVSIRTEVRNRESAPAKIRLETAILDPEGRQVAGRADEATVAAGATQVVAVELGIARPTRWELDRPYLYTATSVVAREGVVLDRYLTPFGIRTIEYGPGKGFLLNGRRVRFQGVCDHHDLGALGTAVHRRAIERQLEILRRMGANAIRTSHNPPAPELLELADRMGFLVMDEAFDMWGRPKVKNGHGRYFAEWGDRDLRDMIRRDRNHPSVVMWSIGNEVREQGEPDGALTARRLTAIAHEEDPTRPVTSAFNEIDGAIRNGLADAVDIPGFNYGVREYARILAEHPAWTIVASETASCVSSRGVYHLPVATYEKHPSRQLSSYDVIAPRWAYCPDVEFAGLLESPAVLGEFVWTGFDYLGEPTPYFAWDRPRDENDWPARSSYFGIVDLAGFPKDRFYLYQSQWTRAPMVHLLPHWSWAGAEGRPIPVMAYTSAEEVELFLDGRSLGRKKKGEPWSMPVNEKISKDGRFTSRYRLVWDVPWAPGTLKAVAYAGGRPVATDEVRTAGPPARVVLQPDRDLIAADGQDLSFVTVRIEDERGTLVPGADGLLGFEVTGPGAIAGVDNGNAASIEPFQADHRRAFNGLALLIVRSRRGEPGPISVRATSPGLAPGRAALASR